MSEPYACGRQTPWDYPEAEAALRGALRFGVNASLDNITALCEALGNPQDAVAVVQVAGTNGKTSTARFVQALLSAHGVKAALYTSPELERYPERIEVAGTVVTDAEFATAVGVAVDTASALSGAQHGDPGPVTEFELLTVAALWHFRESGVEVAVLEVGMGGRWDATSVAAPSVAVITGVGLDHMHVLGDTLEKIASEKAAIIRPGCAPVLGPGTAGLENVFLQRARESSTHARLVRMTGEASVVAEDLTVRYEVIAQPDSPDGELVVDVRGVHAVYDRITCRMPAYQAPNIATAVAAAEAALGRFLDPSSVRSAMATVRVPGRFEVVATDPLVIVDAAHNPQAAHILADTVRSLWPCREDRPTLVLGVLADKDAEGIVAALAPVFPRVVITSSLSPRALAPEYLARSFTGHAGVDFDTAASVSEALESVRLAGGSILVTGSITVAGEARRVMAGR